MRLRKNRKIERTAVNAARTFFEEHNCVFQEVDAANDYGKDAYVDLVDGDRVTGTCIAVQIKGGRKYRRAKGFAIPLDEEHFQIWHHSTLPVAAIVHDPESGNLYWTSITSFLAASLVRPKSIPIPLSNQLTPFSLCSEFRNQFRDESKPNISNCVLDLSSRHEDRRIQSIYDCFGMGRSDPRVLITLRYFLPALSASSLKCAISVLTHVTPHPDIFWNQNNWISQDVRNAVRQHLCWSIDEIIQLTEVAKWDAWHRGEIGEDVYMLLIEDPEIKEKMRHVIHLALRLGKCDAAFVAAYLCVYWAGENGKQMYDELVIDEPYLPSLPLMPSVRSMLLEYGYVVLFE